MIQALLAMILSVLAGIKLGIVINDSDIVSNDIVGVSWDKVRHYYQ